MPAKRLVCEKTKPISRAGRLPAERFGVSRPQQRKDFRRSGPFLIELIKLRPKPILRIIKTMLERQRRLRPPLAAKGLRILQEPRQRKSGLAVSASGGGACRRGS